MGDVHTSSCVDLYVEQTRDKELLKSLIGCSEIINGFTDDVNLENYINNIGDKHLCYLTVCDGEVAGVLVALKMHDFDDMKNCYIADIGFFKKYRGKVAQDLCEMTINKFFNDVKCEHLFASIDKKNRAALFNAKRIGFKIINVTEDKYYLRYE
jgi:ribosomal protein S18 acetylase RimI-like enzyme